MLCILWVTTCKPSNIPLQINNIYIYKKLTVLACLEFTSQKLWIMYKIWFAFLHEQSDFAVGSGANRLQRKKNWLFKNNIEVMLWNTIHKNSQSRTTFAWLLLLIVTLEYSNDACYNYLKKTTFESKVELDFGVLLKRVTQRTNE
mgnify:CR=1 FL=1